MGIQEKYIRKMAKAGKLHFSDHALLRMGERLIRVAEVTQAVCFGKEIEIQNFGPNKDIRVLFQEATTTTPKFYVVVATSYPSVEVITVAPFKEEAWEHLEGIMRRR